MLTPTTAIELVLGGVLHVDPFHRRLLSHEAPVMSNVELLTPFHSLIAKFVDCRVSFFLVVFRSRSLSKFPSTKLGSDVNL